MWLQVKSSDEAVILCKTAIGALKLNIGDLQVTKVRCWLGELRLWGLLEHCDTFQQLLQHGCVCAPVWNEKVTNLQRLGCPGGPVDLLCISWAINLRGVLRAKPLRSSWSSKPSGELWIISGPQLRGSLSWVQ